jgi:hypothetical protein
VSNAGLSRVAGHAQPMDLSTCSFEQAAQPCTDKARGAGDEYATPLPIMLGLKAHEATIHLIGG